MGGFEMKNWNWNLILKNTICIWAAISILIFFYKIDNPNIKAEMHPILYYTVEQQEIEVKAEALEPTPFFELNKNEYNTVCYIVAGEAGNESFEGKVAVANCILNACLIEGKMPSEIRIEYQYSGWNDKLQYQTDEDSKEDWAEVQEAVYSVFYEGELIDTEILYFYSPANCYSSWHESQKFVLELDGHRFFAPWN